MVFSFCWLEDSLVIIFLLIIWLWEEGYEFGKIVFLFCDLGIFMCDLEWKVKIGVEIFIFIY